MRKRTYIILFLLIILILTPWVAGIIFKKNFLHVVEAVNQDNRIKIEILEYHQGWLSSKAKVRITFVNKELNQLQLNVAVPLSFILEDNIQHGPIIYDKHLQKIQFGYAQLHNELLTDHTRTGLIQVDILSEFNGNWSGQFKIDAASFSLPPFSKIVTEPLTGHFAFTLDNKNITRINTDLQTGSILLEGDESNTAIKKMAVEPIKAQYDAVHETNGLWSGSSSIYTPGVTIMQMDGANFIIEKFAITNTFSVGENTFYNTNLAIFMKSVVSPSYTIPAFSKLQIILSAKNFSTKALNEYITFIKSTTPEELKNIDIKKLETLLAHTITPTTTLEGSISSDTSLGSFTYRSKTKWPASTPLPDTFNDMITHSFTKIRLKLSNLLVVKLLNIYGDQITATTDKQVAEFKKKAKTLEKQYFENQRPSDVNDFRQKVAVLSKQGKMTTAQSMQVLELEKQNQTLAMFSTNINQLRLPTDIKNQLIASYQAELENHTNVVTSDDKIKQLISDLISVGYLNKDKDTDGYTSKLTIENGILKIYESPVLPEQAAKLSPEPDEEY